MKRRLQRRERCLLRHSAVRVENEHREVIETARDTEAATRGHLGMVATDASRTADVGNTTTAEAVISGS